MSALPNDIKISRLSIPGTHDSATHFSIPGKIQAEFASKCQSWSIYNQLMAGIRFLDMRVCYDDRDLYMAHGPITFNKLKY